MLYYINVFMSPFTLSLHLFFDRPLFLRRAVASNGRASNRHAPNWENAPNCRAPNWHRVEMGRDQLDRVKQARVKKYAPNWIPVHFGASFLTRACLTRSSWTRPTSTRCQFGARQFGAFFQFGACQFDARPFEAFCNGNRQHAAHFMPHVTISSTNSSSTV